MLVSDSILRKVIDVALSKGADFAEVYLEDTRRRQFSILDGRPEKAISGHSLGAGIRIFSGTEQTYTYTNDLSEDGLIRAARGAAAAMAASGKHASQPLGAVQVFGQARELKPSRDSEKQWSALRQMDRAPVLEPDHASPRRDGRDLQVRSSVELRRTA
jgi:TldD protein